MNKQIQNKKMKCRFFDVNLKLFIEAPDSITKLYVLFKHKPLSFHVTTLELYGTKEIFFKYEDIILWIFKCNKYFINISKIGGSLKVSYRSILVTKTVQPYRFNHLLFKRFKNIKINKLHCRLITHGVDMIRKDPDQSNMYLCDFSELLPILDIIPLIHMKLNIESLRNERINFKGFEMFKNSLIKLTLILNSDCPDLSELQILKCLDKLKDLKLIIQDIDSWKNEDKKQILPIIRNLAIISIQIQIKTAFTIINKNSENLLQIFLENLLLEISYLDNLEDLSLDLDFKNEFILKSKKELLIDSIYEFHKNKIQFSKLKRLVIKLLSCKNVKLIINNIIYNNQINLNNLISFELHGGFNYILTNKNNIIFDNMNNIKYLTIYSRFNDNICYDILLKNIDNFFNGINNLTKLEYLNIKGMSLADITILKRGLMILNHLYNLKVFKMNWIIDHDDEYKFIKWLKYNLKVNNSLKYLSINIIPIENYNTLCEIINIIKIKYKNVCELRLRVGYLSYKYDFSKICRKYNKFNNLFNELYLL